MKRFICSWLIWIGYVALIERTFIAYGFSLGLIWLVLVGFVVTGLLDLELKAWLK